MSARMIVDGHSIRDVVDQMNDFPGGQHEHHPPCGFQFTGNGYHDPDDSGEFTGWDFDLGQPVEIVATGETGFISKRTESLFGKDEYFVQYDQATGGEAEKWFDANDLNLLVPN